MLAEKTTLVCLADRMCKGYPTHALMTNQGSYKKAGKGKAFAVEETLVGELELWNYRQGHEREGHERGFEL